MIEFASFSDGRPGRLQQAVAWALCLGVIILLGYILVLAFLNWQENDARIRDFAEKATKLQMHQEDPKPLAEMLGKLRQVPFAEVGYVDGATEEEARVSLEQSISSLLSAQQVQIVSFRRQPSTAYGAIHGLRFDVQVLVNSRILLPFLASLEQAKPLFVLSDVNAERRQDGTVLIGLKVESYWAPSK